MDILHSDYKKLICLENLFRAWQKFKIGKSRKMEVMRFERNLEDNLFLLYQELKSETYQHAGYRYFKISDPKKRDVYKASIRDKVVHQALYDYLRQIYEPLFIKDSYSSRLGKGTHKAVKRLKTFTAEIAKNNFGRCCAIKCDIRKFFENINHKILLNILQEEIQDRAVVWLLSQIIKGFNGTTEKGIPLGNVTSQIFANIYLHKLDCFVKNQLKIKYYVRYNDDFVILDSAPEMLFESLGRIKKLVERHLALEMPKSKTIFRKLSWGIDFCGYVVLPNAILLKKKTERRMFKNIARVAQNQAKEITSFSDFSKVINSYFGLLKHCNSYNIKEKIKNQFIYGVV